VARRARRRGRGTGTVAAVAAVGLIALSGPVTEVAATVTASRTALPAVPAPAAVLPGPVTVVAPAPAARAAVPRSAWWTSRARSRSTSACVPAFPTG
jgi:hypothetical protein